MSNNNFSIPVDEEIIKLLPRQLAHHYRIVSIAKEADQLILLTDQDLELLADELLMALDCKFKLQASNEQTIQYLLQRYYFEDKTYAGNSSQQVLHSDNDFLDNLISEAKKLKSSDIHIERFDSRGRVRIRIDGLMVERYTVSKDDYPALINKIKILANMDIAEKRLPQDGRIHYSSRENQFDIRVSILPTLHGEKVVMRLLNPGTTTIEMESLGMSEADLNNYLRGIKKPNGIVLISGPTGSGKTTTLYATLKYLNKESTNVLTIEDPIEYTLEGINQVQLRENIGLTFAAALRTFLRQDPDVIMLGEIRDPETANMAIRAALTGHLVLSTIHTNSAWSTISRLIDMGVPEFLIANTLNTSVAQRLVRLLCPYCKKQEPMDKSLYPENFKPYRQVSVQAVAKGCKHCYHTGFKGRKAVYEIIVLDRELADEIKKENQDVDKLLQERGIKSLGENAFELFVEQLTTIGEIYPLLFNF